MLLGTPSKRNHALVHFLSSTGARVGVIDENFIMKYLENISDGYKALLLYPNENEEYWAFLTPEAFNSLDEYHEERKKRGEIFDDNSPIFRRDYSTGKKVIPMRVSSQLCLG